MMKAIKEFLWYQEGDEIKEADKEHFKAWKESGLISGDISVEPVVEKEKLDLDVNNDGKVDAKDISIMAKEVGKRGGRPKKVRGKR